MLTINDDSYNLDIQFIELLSTSSFLDLPTFCSIDDEVTYSLGLFSNPPSPMSRARHWCFTLNNFEAEDIARIDGIEAEVDYVIYGREVGVNGTPHLQGFVSFKSRVRLATAVGLIGQAHFTVARHIDQAIEYCKKDGLFTEFGNRPRSPGSRSDLDDFKAAVVGGELNMTILRSQFSDVIARYPKFAVDFVQDNMPRKEVAAHPLREWQQTLNHDLLLPADDRSIIFIVDDLGNTGKSWFCHYYASLHDNAQVLLPGKKADMSYMLSPLIRVLFIDAPRSKQGEYLQYDFLEDVKNGYVFSPKYESRVKHIGKVHVVVMMNEMPDQTKLSRDRYDIRRI
jgi:Putative viral replication protein